MNKPVGSTDTSTTAQFVLAVSKDLGVVEAVEAAHLTPAQSSELAGARALPVHSLQPGPAKGAAHTTSLIGLILIFVMLSQYNTWILIGVMEEKSSRVIEVLLAAVRPIQLLTGKVLGIGLVAFVQASAIVVVRPGTGQERRLRSPARNRTCGALEHLGVVGAGLRLLLLGLCRRRFLGRTPGPGAEPRFPLEPPDHLRLHHGPHCSQPETRPTSSRSSPICPRRPRSPCRSSSVSGRSPGGSFWHRR